MSTTTVTTATTSTATTAPIMNNHNANVYPRSSPTEPYYIQGTVVSTPPSHDASPTDVQSPIKVRQLRQPRQPLYIPAALRPTDMAGRPRGPDTPPASKDNSFDSGKSGALPSFDFPASLRLGSEGSDGAIADDEQDALRRSLSRVDSERLLEENFGEVTGAPTTAHWKPDESSNVCGVCNATFTWFFRRHHCRRCGGLVCDQHLKHNVPLDQNARYHPNGVASKACTPCWEGWKIVKRLHHSRTNSIAESSNSSQGTAMPIPNLPKPADEARVGSMARSEGMVWSTF